MEMSRQRLRTGVLEASTRQCPHCEGTGLVRTASSAGLSALRMIEDEAARGRGSQITLRASQEAAFYVLNKKRADIAEIEDRYGVQVVILSDGETEGARMTVEASGPPPVHAPRFEALIEEEEEDDFVEEDLDEEEEAEEERTERGERGEQRERSDDDSDAGRKRRRRRRGRRGRGRDEAGDDVVTQQPREEGDAGGVGEEAEAVEHAAAGETEGEGETRGRRRRRGRRGGRRTEGATDAVADAEEADAGDAGAVIATHANPDVPVAVEPDAAPEAEVAPKRTRRRPKARIAEETATAPVVEAAPASEPEPEAVEPAAKPKRSRKKAAPVEAEAANAEPVPAEMPVAAEAAVASPSIEAAEPAAKPKRSRKKAAPADTATESDVPTHSPAAANDADETPVAADADGAAPADDAAGDTDGDGSPRRGWWQRTFGA